jgi:catechol 2,3-dioxygenase-like lactoylglutathione lyase family enzyme
MNDQPLIAGIQQIGIGIPDVHAAFKWYREHFGMDIRIFEEAAVAGLMLPYTGGQPQGRHAILALNMRGGGGFEIWQYTSRVPQPCPFEILLGDLGFFCARIKSVDVTKSYSFLRGSQAQLLSGLEKDPGGQDTFFLRDPWGNHFQIVPGDSWFGKASFETGGAAGFMIGVSDMERSMKFYAEILGYDTVVYDTEGQFDDLRGLPGGDQTVRRVLLKHGKPRQGPFSQLLGSSELELVCVKGRKPRKIFEDRFWGDLGFIHLCFDITNQPAMKRLCMEKGHPYTVESGASFDMGEAAGHFSYIEDPDGALIEFVETRRIPILKKFGWYLDLSKRDNTKSLPKWMLKTLNFSRVKS